MTQGEKTRQEDAYAHTVIHTATNQQIDVVAIFDGHCDRSFFDDGLSLYLQQNIHHLLSVFFQQRLLTRETVRDFFLFLADKTKEMASGSCATLVFFDRAKCFFGSVGDTEVLIPRGQKMITLPVHKFTDANERKRFPPKMIVKNRYKGLNISRIFGDKHIKGPGKSPLDPFPSISSHTLENGETMLLYLFTDGIREALSNEAVFHIERKVRTCHFDPISEKDRRCSLLAERLENFTFYDNATLLVLRYTYTVSEFQKHKQVFENFIADYHVNLSYQLITML